jgi:large subunit ribosomal protein L13
MDCGDHVIVVNAEKVVFTGNKRKDKTYYWHTGFPGGIKERKAHQILDGKFPERVLEAAVRRMIPEGPLRRQQMTHLRIYKGPAHPHEAQAMNPKNALRDS